jgi:hypothetical protein
MAPDPRRPRVFGIGLNKTATTSFHEAMLILGYASLHWGGPPVRALVERALEEQRPLLDDLDPEFEVFSDIEALSLNFAVLDVQYPGSRFVLTTRNEDAWIDSRRRHVERNRRRKEAGEYGGGFLEVDEPAWRNLWRLHHESVERYFTGRDDLLTIDLTAEPTWERLCEFLGDPIPPVMFPWVNRGKSPGPAR